MNAPFSKNERVRGVVCGEFVVKSVKKSVIDAGWVVSVNEVSPEGLVSRKTLRFPADVLVSKAPRVVNVCPDEAFPRV